MKLGVIQTVKGFSGPTGAYLAGALNDDGFAHGLFLKGILWLCPACGFWIGDSEAVAKGGTERCWQCLTPMRLVTP